MNESKLSRLDEVAGTAFSAGYEMGAASVRSDMRPLLDALRAWVGSWDDAETTPDPQDLPEEAALYRAAKEMNL